MKTPILIFFIFIFTITNISCKTIIYALPGQGSDKRIFDSLKINENYQLKVIEYGTPESGMNLKDFALTISKQIDTSKPFILLGVSLGGMLCVEMSEILHPLKTIIISSAKNAFDLPRKYSIQKQFPLYKIFPPSWIKNGALFLQPIVEPDRNKYKTTFKSMLDNKDKVYMKRTVELIVNWERTNNSNKIYHIHGNNDHTIPIKNIRNVDIVIPGASHMMTLTQANEISLALNQLLSSSFINQ